MPEHQNIEYKESWRDEYLSSLNLEDRQINALLFIKQNGYITNTKYQELFNVSKRTATNDLQSLAEREFIERIGTTGKGTSYVLRSNKGAVFFLWKNIWGLQPCRSDGTAAGLSVASPSIAHILRRMRAFLYHP